ncbi:tryptophan synthase subunit alpha [Streptomyces sp. NBC_00624]|uniref:tryptophan synthase subunit alpha n=1 Tax=Streptomyces sp. NBC_00624 TaxID=2975791 RepID=UPI002F9099AC
MTTSVYPQQAWAGPGLGEAFATARTEGRAALAAYWPVGYPTVDQSMDALHAISAYADILELGVPFSDPMLDGPTIQHAMAQALAHGFRMRHLFTAIRELAASSAVLVMTYWQPVAHFGPDRFAAELACAGAAGVILPDLPLEEAGPWLDAARAHGLHTVPVVAPASTDARLARVCAAASGMIYAPAVAGVTGTQGPLASGLVPFVDRVRAVTAVPVGVGFGVSTADQAAIVASFADAVIVGSALIRQLNTLPGPAGIAATVELARDLADGVRYRLSSATNSPVPSGLAPGASRLPTYPTTAEEPALTIHHLWGRTAPALHHAATSTPQVSSTAATLPTGDQALCAFLRKRIAEAGAYGCSAEQKALSGAEQVLDEFEERHPRLPQMAHDDVFVAQIVTLRWVLRCIAARTYSNHPEFQPAFRPSIPVPAQSLEAHS